MADDEWSALDEELEKALSGKKGRGKGGRGGDRGGSDHGSGRAGHPPVRRDAPAPPPPRPSTSGARWTRSSRSSSAAARDPTKTAGTTARGPDVRTNPRSNTTIVNNNNNVNINTNHTVSFRTKPLGSSLLLRPPQPPSATRNSPPAPRLRRAPRGSLDVVVVCPRGGIRGSRRRLRRHHLLRRRHLHHLHHPLHSAASHRRHVSSDVPPSERRSRESAREIDLLERGSSDPSVSSESLAVKKFTRVVDNPAPETIRDKAALDATLAHLYSLLGGRADYANLPGEIPLVRRANFLWDRLRGVRQDMSLQAMRDAWAVERLEQMARFAVAIEYLLCDERMLGGGVGAGDGTGGGAHNSHLHVEQLGKTLAETPRTPTTTPLTNTPTTDDNPKTPALRHPALRNLMPRHPAAPRTRTRARCCATAFSFGWTRTDRSAAPTEPRFFAIYAARRATRWRRARWPGARRAPRILRRKLRRIF